MAISHLDHSHYPPPPLPPPINLRGPGLPADQPWPFNNNPNWQGFTMVGRMNSVGDQRITTDSRDIMTGPQERERALKPYHITSTRQDSTRTMTKGDGSKTPSEETIPGQSPNYRLHSERQLERRSLNTSSQAYDRNLLSKIGGPNATPVRTASYPSSSGDPATISPGLPDARPRLSIPDRRRSSNDARYSVTSDTYNKSSASILSPTSFRSSSIFEAPRNHRTTDRHHPTFTFEDHSSSHRDSVDVNMCPPDELPMEAGPMEKLNLNDRTPRAAREHSTDPRAGMKRRASSPPKEISHPDKISIGYARGPTNLYQRRSQQQIQPQTSPGLRYNSSISSSSSFGYRTASMSSSRGLSVASSATSFGSGHLSPHRLSLAIDPDLSPSSPGSKWPTASPRSSVSTQFPRPGLDQANHSPLPVLPDNSYHDSVASGMLICDCCPKKPKKFNTEEELRMHHMEKQYICAYCPNRFKNKNEAERHQNSLHLRRHSWACAALPSVEAAFHPSQANGGLTDVCGYCGEDFSNPVNTVERREHLITVHKYMECNRVKKFYRADHFRQHLKHSHAGTSGKWTNVLETACMRDEPLPVPINRGNMPGGAASGIVYPQMGVGATLPPSPTAMLQPGRQHDTINEVPQEHQ